MPDLWFDETYTDRHEHYPRIRPTSDHTNDDHVCFYCQKHVDDIAGELHGHADDCSWALHHKEREAAGKPIRSHGLTHNKWVEVSPGRISELEGGIVHPGAN
jgi:hypothetical protein